MRLARLLFGFAVLCASCGGKPAPLAEAPRPAAPQPAPPAPPVLPTACRAEPSTVYGTEHVSFEIESPSPTRVAVQLVDQKGKAVAADSIQAPGQWRPADVASGDFSLVVGPNRISCAVTVNRELSRATQPAH